MFKGRTVSNADPKAQAWASAIVRAAHEALAPAGAIHVNLLFRMPTNKSNRHGQPHTFRPDSDNLAKLVLDALMRSKSITDDSAVSRLSVRKVWSAEDRAGVDILVESDTGLPADSPIDPPRWLAGGGNVGH